MRNKSIGYVLCFASMSFLSHEVIAGNAKQKVEVQCGQHKATIICGRDNTPKRDDPRECNHNTLTFTSPSGVIVVAKDPSITKKFHDDKRPVMLYGMTPDQLTCIRALNGKDYVEVRYSRSLNPFSGDLFYDSFESSGKRLTSIGIPLKKNFVEPETGLNWQQLPKPISIEGE
jgi:hypothetical protein